MTRTSTLNKNIEIDGANCGHGRNRLRGAESIIRGQMTVSAAHSATAHVTINGVEIYNTSDNATRSSASTSPRRADVTVSNSVFYSPVAKRQQSHG